MKLETTIKENNDVIINKQLIGNLKGLKLNLEFTKGTLDTDIKSLKRQQGKIISNELIRRTREIIEKENLSLKVIIKFIGKIIQSQKLKRELIIYHQK